MTVARAYISFLLASATVVGCPATIQAQDAAVPATQPQADNGKRQFRADFFAAYAPVTALDMVRRIPGFSIAGDEGRRGFGENAGNVLIDGDRPSSKSDDIFTILGRIPASEVDYIELTEQAGADAETQGQGQVVNIIRKISAKVSGTYEANIVAGRRYGFQPSANASATLRRGDTSYEFNFSSYSERIYGFGPEDFKTRNGALIERRHYQGKGGFDQASIGGAIKTKFGGAKVNLNGRVRWADGFDRREADYFNSAFVDIGDELLLRGGPIDAWSNPPLP